MPANRNQTRKVLIGFPQIVYSPVGIVHSPFKEPKGTPIQPAQIPDSIAEVEVFTRFAAGLTDLEGFSHIILLFHMHLVKKFRLKVIPFMDHVEHGIFATRSPARPNAIGMSVVKLEKIEKNILHIKGIDILDNTPVLDIKPFVPEFDIREKASAGWFEKTGTQYLIVRDDGRFC